MADVPSGGGSSGSSGSSSGSGLSHKLGPLPVWGWLVVAVGAYLVYRYLHDRAASSSTGTTATGATIATTGARTSGGAIIGSTGSIITPTTGDKIGTTGTATSGATTATGQGWAVAAENALLGLGYNPTSVDSAMQGYLAGNKLTAGQFSIVEAAIKLVGNPPSALGSPQSGGTPPPAPPPTETQNPSPPAATGTPPVTYAAQLATTTLGGTIYALVGYVNGANNLYTGHQVKNGAPILFTWTGNGIPTTQGVNPNTNKRDLAVWVPKSAATSANIGGTYTGAY